MAPCLDLIPAAILLGSISFRRFSPLNHLKRSTWAYLIIFLFTIIFSKTHRNTKERRFSYIYF